MFKDYRVAEHDFRIILPDDRDFRPLLVQYEPFEAGTVTQALFILEMVDSLDAEAVEMLYRDEAPDEGQTGIEIYRTAEGSVLACIAPARGEAPKARVLFSPDYCSARFCCSDEDFLFALNNALMLQFAFATAPLRTLELHASVNEFDTERQTIFDDCWSYAHVVDGYEYQFENEFFLTYFYAHAAKHFAHGGCGVRPFIDCFLLNKKMPYDHEKLQTILVGEGVDRFAEAMEKLAEVWFANGRHNAVTERMAAFVLRGGVYGSLNNTMSVRQQQEKGVHGYLLRRLCIPYATLCEFYPILRKHPYLTPLYRVRRWFRAFMPRTRASFRNDVRAISGISEKNRSDTGFLLCELGLNDFVPLE